MKTPPVAKGSKGLMRGEKRIQVARRRHYITEAFWSSPLGLVYCGRCQILTGTEQTMASIKSFGQELMFVKHLKIFVDRFISFML